MQLNASLVRSEEPELAWSLEEEGLQFRSDSLRSVETKKHADARNAKATRKSEDEDDGPGPSGTSIVAKIMPYFTFTGSPALA
jgi:hypothetical protein